MKPIILVHGGAGDIPEGRVPGKIAGVKLCAREGFKVLLDGGSALDAVELAVRIMEDDEHFNAGYGSVLNLDGEVEMEASIMDGRNLSAGAVTLLKDVANPITVARKVMENTTHVLLGAEGADRFVKEHGIPTVPPASLVSPYAEEALEAFKKTGYIRTEIGPTEIAKSESGGTVGAVALDKDGNLAAATSTGGMNGKMVGRIGDTPLIGSGTYADNNSGAVSTTGHGESILKYCLAHAIVHDMENGTFAQDATANNIKKMTVKLNNTAGAITLSRDGGVGVYFTSKRMAWAYHLPNELHFGINQNDHQIEQV